MGLIETSRSIPPRLDGVTILIVEDHADSRDAARQLLAAQGARVLVAEDGREALEILVTDVPHVVLCDLRMPRMDGFEFLDRLNRDPRRALIRVIAVTGLGAEGDYYRTWEAGFDGHVTKPVDYLALCVTLDQIARRSAPTPPVKRRGSRRPGVPRLAR